MERIAKLWLDNRFISGDANSNRNSNELWLENRFINDDTSVLDSLLPTHWPLIIMNNWSLLDGPSACARHYCRSSRIASAGLLNHNRNFSGWPLIINEQLVAF